jgi:hypothetical protein
MQSDTVQSSTFPSNEQIQALRSAFLHEHLEFYKRLNDNIDFNIPPKIRTMIIEVDSGTFNIPLSSGYFLSYVWSGGVFDGVTCHTSICNYKLDTPTMQCIREDSLDSACMVDNETICFSFEEKLVMYNWQKQKTIASVTTALTYKWLKAISKSFIIALHSHGRNNSLDIYKIGYKLEKIYSYCDIDFCYMVPDGSIFIENNEQKVFKFDIVKSEQKLLLECDSNTVVSICPLSSDIFMTAVTLPHDRSRCNIIVHAKGQKHTYLESIKVPISRLRGILLTHVVKFQGVRYMHKTSHIPFLVLQV